MRRLIILLTLNISLMAQVFESAGGGGTQGPPGPAFEINTLTETNEAEDEDFVAIHDVQANAMRRISKINFLTGLGLGNATSIMGVTINGSFDVNRESTFFNSSTGQIDVRGFFTEDIVGGTPISRVYGGTGLGVSADHNVMVGNGTSWQSRTLPSCDPATQKLQYTYATRLFTCVADANSGGGGGLTDGDKGHILVTGGGTTLLIDIPEFVDDAFAQDGSATINIDCTTNPTGPCLIGVDTTKVALKDGAAQSILNTWDFFAGKLGIPKGASLVTGDCNETGEQGRLFFLTTDNSMYKCSGLTGWSVIGGGTVTLASLDTWDSSVIWEWDEFMALYTQGGGKLGWFCESTSGNLVTVITGESSHPGIWRMSTPAAGATDFTSCSLRGNTNNGLIATAGSGTWFGSWKMRFLVRQGTTTNMIWQVGLAKFASSGTTAPRIYAGFESGQNSNHIMLKSCPTTCTGTITTGIVAAAATWYEIVLERTATAGTIRLTVNGGTPVELTGVSMPDAVSPYLFISGHTAAATKTFDLDRFDMRFNGVTQRY